MKSKTVTARKPRSAIERAMLRLIRAHQRDAKAAQELRVQVTEVLRQTLEEVRQLRIAVGVPGYAPLWHSRPEPYDRSDLERALRDVDQR